MSFVKDKICYWCKEPMLDKVGELYTTYGWMHSECYTVRMITDKLKAPKRNKWKGLSA